MTPANQARLLASFEPRTSLEALERSLSTSGTLLNKLAAESIWINFESVRNLVEDPSRKVRAQAVIDDLRDALEADQLNVKLEEKLDELTRRAGELLKTKRPPPPPPPPSEQWKELTKKTVDVPDGSDVVTVLLGLAEELEGELGDDGRTGKLRVELTVLRREGDKS